MTIKDVAKYLKLSLDTIYKLAQKGEVPASKIGKQWRFKRKEIDKWADKFRRDKGLTLIEVSIFIVLLAILSFLSIPAINSYYSSKLRGTANKIVQDIRYCQRLAMDEGKVYGIGFLPTQERYEAYHNSWTQGNLAIDPLTRGEFIIDFTDSNLPYSGMEIVSTNLMGNRLEFSSLGIPSDLDGPLSGEKNIQIRFRNQTFKIVITPNTGKVTIQ